MKIVDKEKIEKDFEEIAVRKPLIEPITETERFMYSFKVNRDPYIEFPDRLPTFGKNPLPPDEHKHIGLYENKQTLYLITAHSYNRAMEKIEELSAKIALLEQKLNQRIGGEPI